MRELDGQSGLIPLPIPAHDLHTHTIYCGHAAEDATVTNLAARANELELEYLGISEHVFNAEDAGYLYVIDKQLHRIASPKTRLLLGVEVDPHPVKLDGSWVTHDLHVDYVILSMHTLPKSGLGAGEFGRLRLTEAERDTMCWTWLDWLGKCIDHGGMDILGHPLREPITMGLFSLRDERVLRRAIEVLTMAAKQDIAFELNDAWMGNLALTNQFEPYVLMLRELKRQGIKFSRGSDAHSAENVGNSREIAEIARHVGIEPTDWIKPSDFGRNMDWEV